MYHPPRPSGRNPSLSAANSSRTNPLRSNNDREEPSEGTADSLRRSMADSESDLSGSQSEGQDSRDMQLLNQIIQQFFAKGALIVVSSRLSFPKFVTKNGNVKQNKWFSIVQDDSEELFEKTINWRTLQIEDRPPPPMTIEIYLDLKDLTQSQSLVVLDEQGKRWDVADFLGQLPSSTRQTARSTQLVLERWEFTLDNPVPIGNIPPSESLPNIYKRCIPVVRSLLSTSMLLPAWKYFRRLTKAQAAHTTNPSLKLKYRISTGSASKSMDSLTCPLYPGQQNVMSKYTFGSLSTPAGQLKATVLYRNNCEFRVDDSEALLSSHFMGMDDIYFKPSLGRHESQMVGSAPTKKGGVTERLEEEEESTERSQTYGSLSTFHGVGPKLSSSPMTALRNLSQADQSPGSTPQRAMPSPRTQPRPTQGRRVSISFQPFKAGSLASSPGRNSPLSPSRPPIQSIAHRPRSSITTHPQAILRGPNITSETAVASSTSSSPKPAPINRYSSSFSHRRSRLSSGASRGEDEAVRDSSGRSSPAGSAQQQQQESGSVQKTDDESLQDFLKFIEQKKDLALTGKESASQAGLRTTAALARYRGIKDSARELSDSLSSSLAMKGTAASSVTTSSGRMPGMIAGAGVRDTAMGSIASSISPGGKPLSPHAAFTPAVPSRLSANSVVDDDANAPCPEPKRSRSRLRPDNRDRSRGEPRKDEDVDDPKSIPIPTSPTTRPWTYGRRASSVRPVPAEDEAPEQKAFNFQGAVSQSLPEERNERLSLNDDPPSAEGSMAQILSPPLGETESEEQPAVFTTAAEFSQRGSPFTIAARSRGSASGRGTPASPRVSSIARTAAPQAEAEEYSPGGSSSLGQASASGSVRDSSALASASGSYRRSIHQRGGSGARNPLSRAQQSQTQDDDGELMFIMSELGSARRSQEDARTSGTSTGSGSGRVFESRRSARGGERQG